MPTEQEYADLSASDKKKEDWMNSKWRPMMGWMYMIVCMFDFTLAPILWSLTQAFFHGGIATQWQPLTLQGAGLFHIAMGAVLGIAAYGRTQEKLSGANNGGLQQPVGTTYVPPGMQAGMNNNLGGSPGFGNNSTFGSPGFGNNSTFGSPGFGNNSTFGSTSGGFGSAPPAPIAPAPSFGAVPLGGNTVSTAPPAFGSTTPSFGVSPPSVLPSGVGAPPPAFGAKPIGPAANAFPPL